MRGLMSRVRGQEAAEPPPSFDNRVADHPYRPSSTGVRMRVCELIELLQRLPSDSLVVVDDCNGRSQPSVRMLRLQEVDVVGLRFHESGGIGWVELADDKPADAHAVYLGGRK